MLSVLPLCVLLLAARAARSEGRLLIGAVVVGVWGTIGAEVLSLGHVFAAGPVAAWWGAAVVALAAVRRRGAAMRLAVPSDSTARRTWGIVAGVVIATGLLAFLTPPTTWDALSYHLPRQLYWIENRTVAVYPATDLRQLEMPPWAEFMGAQLMLLSGTDHQANLVQWFSLLLGALAASALARELGAGERGGALAALLTVVNPAAATQAENAKNDLAVALWGLILAWSVARVWTRRRAGWCDAAMVGASLGLLLLTKGTGYLLAAPLCGVAGAALLRARGAGTVRWGLAAAMIAVAMNAGHWSRNLREFGSPMSLPASHGGHDLTNGVHGPLAVASNIVRNASLHLNTPFAGVNAWEQRWIERMHATAGIDASDPRTTSPRGEPFAVDTSWFRDGSSGSPLHLGVAAALGLGIVARGRRWRELPAWPIWLAPFAGLLIFCIALKWQPWHARLHIPFFALMAPAAGAWLGTRRRWVALAAVVGLIETAPSILWDQTKPLVGEASVLGRSRMQVLFGMQPGMLEAARDAVNELAAIRPAELAFDIPAYSCEYAPMRLALDTLEPTPRFWALHPNYGRGGGPPACPDAVLCLNRGAGAPMRDPGSGDVLVHLAGGGAFKVYVPAARLARAAVSTPAFYGWDREDGLLPVEGPYPQWDLPEVRWANSAVTTLGFVGQAEEMELRLDVRRNDRTDQTMTVRLNGEVLGRYSFGDLWAFVPVRFKLPTHAGRNVITLEYANTNEPGPARSVLFRTLQILPEARVATAPARADER